MPLQKHGVEWTPNKSEGRNFFSRNFCCRFCQDLNSQRFSHESCTLPTSYPGSPSILVYVKKAEHVWTFWLTEFSWSQFHKRPASKGWRAGSASKCSGCQHEKSSGESFRYVGINNTLCCIHYPVTYRWAWSISAHLQTRLLRQVGRLSKHHCHVNKVCGHVVLEKDGQVLWGCADWTVSLNTCGVVYFAHRSRQSYMSRWREVCDYYVSSWYYWLSELIVTGMFLFLITFY